MEMLEKRIRQLEIELVKHVERCCFSSHQAEEVRELKERLGLLEKKLPRHKHPYRNALPKW